MNLINDEGDVNVIIEFQRNVLKWLRFTEIITVLNVSFFEINDRWVDGKGLLVNEFIVLEVKQMIRVLFQNIDRRLVILVKIRQCCNENMYLCNVFFEFFMKLFIVVC